MNAVHVGPKSDVFIFNVRLLSVTMPLSVVSLTVIERGSCVSSVRSLPSDDNNEVPVALGADTLELKSTCD